MEIIVTLAYFFLVRMIFFDYKLLKFNLFWKFVVFGLYAGAALTEIIALGQFTLRAIEHVLRLLLGSVARRCGDSGAPPELQQV